MRARLSQLSLTSLVTAACVGLGVLFTVSQLHPEQLLADTTTAGGDMGAHVWGPQFLRDHVLPDLRITGWTQDWYAGFPALHFYFPLPSILIVLLDLVLPYGVAFKLVTVAGVCSLPVAAWAFGRLARLPFPVPACLSAVTLFFLFDTGYSILGGNIASTLAGEFAFSVGLSLAFVFLGLVAGGLETGKHRAWAAVLFGLIILSHVLPTIFAFVGGVVLFLMRMLVAGDGPRWYSGRLKALAWGVPVATFGGLLSAFWLLPFVARMPFMNDMGWEKIGTGVESGMTLHDGEAIVDYSDALFPDSLPWLIGVSIVGAFVAVALRRRIGIFWVAIAAISAVGFIYMPQGQLWNARLLPFWFLSLYMLCGLLAAEIGWGAADAFRRLKGEWSQTGKDVGDVLAIVAAPMTIVVTLLIVMASLPKPSWWPENVSFPWHDPGNTQLAQSFIPGWAEWNYSGYERKEAYPEYRSIIDTMAELGRERGCGRAMWEYESGLDRFGTPMALMLLPMWTNSCIGSMEGLFFESSATVPYHFLNQSELSLSPSRAQRNLPYDSLNVAEGVDKLQLFGVKYYLAVSPEAQEQAALEPRLTLLRSLPAAPEAASDARPDGRERTWNIYEVAGSELVSPLVNLPAVMTDPRSVVTDFDLSPDPAEPAGDESAEEDLFTHSDANPRDVWSSNAISWYVDPENFDVPVASSGPAEWPRIDNAAEPLERVAVEPARVEYISTADDRITFEVDRPGVPVLVKTSYFPNWKAEGADGPYRVTPNLMVVVPTSEHVELTYGRTGVDWGSIALTLLGIGGVIWLVIAGRRESAESEPPAPREPATDL